MRQELQRIQQDLRFEGAIEGLRRPDTGSADIDYSLSELSHIREITPQQARLVLNIAISNIPSWVETVGGEQVISAVTPAIDTLRAHTQVSDDESVRNEFGTLATRVVTGIVMAEPDRYDQLAPQIREGRFGEPSAVLTGAARTLLEQGNRGQQYGDGDSGTIASVLDNVIALDDPNLIEPLKPALPLEWLDGDYGERDLQEQFPRVHELLEQPLVQPEEKYTALARMFAASDEGQRENLKNRVKQGEFGDTFEALGKVLGALTSEEMQQGSQVSYADLDAVTEDLWIDMLEINRNDPRLRPLRERVIGREWYWDDNIMYTLVETVDGMGIPVGEEEAFITKHGEAIGQILLDPYHWGNEDRQRYYDGIQLTAQRGELGPRLAAVLGEVRDILSNEGGNTEEVMPNRLLFASLYSPATSQHRDQDKKT